MNLMSKIEIDGLSEYGAMKIADKIRGYWFERGHTVRVWTEPITRSITKDKKEIIYCVRSDLINGRP